MFYVIKHENYGYYTLGEKCMVWNDDGDYVWDWKKSFDQDIDAARLWKTSKGVIDNTRGMMNEGVTGIKALKAQLTDINEFDEYIGVVFNSEVISKEYLIQFAECEGRVADFAAMSPEEAEKMLLKEYRLYQNAKRFIEQHNEIYGVAK